MADAVIQVAGAIGSLLSLIGVGIAIWQIVKTRRAAEAATAASARTSQALVRNVLLSDLTSSSSSLDGVKTLIRTERHEAALLRVSDLMSQLNQLTSLPHGNTEPISFPEVLTQLHVIRDLLERKLLDDQKVKVDGARVIAALSEISDQLNVWIGQAKYTLPGDTTDDS